MTSHQRQLANIMKTHRQILTNIMDRNVLSAEQFSRAIRLAKRVAKEEGKTAAVVFAEFGWNF